MLLSIIIPTHNRAKYAYYSILSILSIIKDDIELVVSDTSTNNELYEKLADASNPLINNPLLKYYRPVESLDMSGNHNFVIGKAIGDYVSLIGDDDTITTDLIKAVIWAKQNNVDVVAPNILSNYAWPDFKSSFFGYGHAGRLYIPRRLGKVNLVNSSFALHGALLNAAQGTEGLPKIYHGIVKRTLINKIIATTGKFFHGSSPDVSGALALSMYTKNFVIVDYPLTIPGASGASNTGRSAMNKHIGKIEDENQTSTFVSNGWSLGVPKFFSVETVWAHAAIETIKAHKQFHLVQQFNFHLLLANCKVKYPQYKRLINVANSEAANLLNESPAMFKKRLRQEELKVHKNRVVHIIKRLLRPPTAAGGRLNISGIIDIRIALIQFTQYMVKKNWTWENFIESKKLIVEESATH